MSSVEPTDPAARKRLAELAQMSPEERFVRLERRDLASQQAGRTLRSRAIVIVVAVVAISSFGTWRAESASDKATHAAEKATDAAARVVRESIDRQVAQCTSANEFRRLFRGYLDTQAGNGSAVEVVTSLAGFEALDPVTQEYIRSVAVLLDTNAANAAEVRKEYVKNFPLQDCKKLRTRLVDQAGKEFTTATRYASCEEARDAGEAPLTEDNPNFNPALDGDNDGIACDD